MEISQKLLGAVFALSVLCGAGLGLLWNLLRLLRALCGVRAAPAPAQRDCPAVCPGRHRLLISLRAVWLFLLDALFGLLCVCVLILLLYYTNDGQFRLLAAAGMGCGFFAWYHTLGRLLGRFTDLMVRGLYFVARQLIRLLLWPPRMIRRAWMATVGKRIAAARQRSRHRRDARRTQAWFAGEAEQAARGFGLGQDGHARSGSSSPQGL